MNQRRAASRPREAASVSTAFLALFLLAGPLVAQPPAPITIAEAIRDSNGDTIPDRLQQLVHVRGVVTIGSNVIADDRLQVHLQDETAGIYIFARTAMTPLLREGDVVDVVGRLDQYRGAPQITRPEYTIVGRTALPKPQTMSVREAGMWPAYGRLVRVRGTTGGWRQEGPNVSFDITGEGETIRVLLPPSVISRFSAETVPEGSTVEVSGVVSIYSLTPPHRRGFRIVVGSPSWIRVLYRPIPQWLRRGALLFVLAAAAIAALVVLIRMIHRRRVRRARQVATLNALSTMAAGAVDDTFLDDAVDLMTRNGMIDGAVLHLLEGKRLTLRKAWHVDEAQVRALDDEVKARFDPALSERGFIIGEPTSVLPAGKAVDAFCYPLQGRSGTIGVLTAFCASGQVATQAEQAVLEAAANLVALGVENVHMLQANEERHRELEQLAISDPLTGLYNRRFMDEYLRIHMAMASRQNAPVSFIAIDVDAFKPVNDRFGHEVGDRVLTELSAVLRSCTRASDLAVRYGGEEFLVVMMDTGEGGAMTFATRFQEALRSHTFSAAGHTSELRLTVSIGIAVYPDHGRSVRQLLRVADESMYESKKQGRDRITVGAGQPQVIDL